jgi:hypothetical protein
MTRSSGVTSNSISPSLLSIKSVVGGGFEDKAWTSAIDNLQKTLQGLQGNDSAEFNLTVTYIIPGEVYSPKFSGIRVGSYLASHGTLVVQVALPEHPGSDARVEILEQLDKAIDRAEAWARKKKMLTGSFIGIRRVAARLHP